MNTSEFICDAASFSNAIKTCKLDADSKIFFEILKENEEFLLKLKNIDFREGSGILTIYLKIEKYTGDLKKGVLDKDFLLKATTNLPDKSITVKIDNNFLRLGDDSGYSFETPIEYTKNLEQVLNLNVLQSKDLITSFLYNDTIKFNNLMHLMYEIGASFDINIKTNDENVSEVYFESKRLDGTKTNVREKENVIFSEKVKDLNRSYLLSKNSSAIFNDKKGQISIFLYDKFLKIIDKQENLKKILVIPEC